MWAGSRIVIHRPLLLGTTATRTSTILSIQQKTGRSGELVFVTIRHEIAADNERVLVEDQDLVFRDRGAPSARDVPAPTHESWRATFVIDPVVLFRYSALTFNSHRIHYDREYAMADEGYPGLVVHGPLIATLLAELVRRESTRRLRTFVCKATSPVFADAELALCGAPAGDDTVALWARTASGTLAMEATATFDVEQP
jgi:3-methylfumaryl-CoA hydratase